MKYPTLTPREMDAVWLYNTACDLVGRSTLYSDEAVQAAIDQLEKDAERNNTDRPLFLKAIELLKAALEEFH